MDWERVNFIPFRGWMASPVPVDSVHHHRYQFRSCRLQTTPITQQQILRTIHRLSNGEWRVEWKQYSEIVATTRVKRFTPDEEDRDHVLHIFAFDIRILRASDVRMCASCGASNGLNSFIHIWWGHIYVAAAVGERRTHAYHFQFVCLWNTCDLTVYLENPLNEDWTMTSRSLRQPTPFDWALYTVYRRNNIKLLFLMWLNDGQMNGWCQVGWLVGRYT